jgi:hypothetical protein
MTVGNGKMRLLRTLFGALLFTVALLGFAGSAKAFPIYDVQTRVGDQNLKPGGFGEFVITPHNIGFEATDGTPVEVTLELPPGVTRVAPLPGDPPEQEGYGWTCSGESTVVCTSTDVIDTVLSSKFLTGGAGQYIFIRVAVDPSASGTHTVKTTMTGGGGFVLPGEDVDEITISDQAAGFGLVPGRFRADAYNGKAPFGTPVRQAASHPYELKVDFEMNLRHEERPPKEPGQSPRGLTTPEGHIRTVEVTLPRGLIGNPEAVPKCSPDDFLASGLVPYTSCPPDTQVGVMDLQLSNGTPENGFGFFKFNPGLWTHIAVYNLQPPKGVPADFGFHVALADGHIYPRLDPEKGYAIKAEVPYTSDLAPVRHAKFTMWGVPGDPAHDELRYKRKSEGEGEFGATFAAPIRPLLTLGSECGRSYDFDWRADSWSNPGQFTPTVKAPAGMQVDGCDDPRIRFEPEVTLQPSSRAAGGPTGLQVDLKVPQRDDTVNEAWELYDSSNDIDAIATPPLKKAVVTLPQGMTISTSAAAGLGNCSLEQLGLGTDRPVTCPENSQYGTLTLHTPILPQDQPMTGKIYVAKQNDNPFNNFLSLYLVIQDPQRGLLVKIPGKVDLDPVSGQITTTFDDLPQFPVSNMSLTFKGGNRAALVNPSTCGTKTIEAEFYSWADPDTPISQASSYEIANKANGAPCVNSLGERPFAPHQTAGTVNPTAGAHSPFVFRVTRSDDDQEFSQLDVSLPPGLLAKIAGIGRCSEAGIAPAEAPGRTGSEEAANPSCPASSQIGSSQVGSGVGQVLTYIPGKVYLAGPYKGAPLSMVVITPILAGPYDLGVIAVRSAIYVQPDRAQASVRTDPFPQIFKGIPVRIRDIQVNVDRPGTMINPTNCSPMQVTSTVTGTGGDVGSTADDTAARLATRFQASDCASLDFKPRLKLQLKGGTHRGDFPALSATLRARPGDANIARTAVTLPHSEFLAQEHIRTVCTRVQFAADACPAASIYGHARAVSPLFDQPLAGPVYLRSSDNPLPDLVAKLDGEIDVVLSGRIDSVNESIRNTFDVVPDAPVTTFTLRMQGGKKGLLVNSRNLCKGKSARADVRMIAQNGRLSRTRPVLATPCKGSPRKR